MIKGKKDQKKERQLLNYNKKLQFFYFDYNIEIDNSIREKKFITFAGIGNPESFFELLTRKNLNVIKKISFLRSESRLIVGLGIQDLIVVETQDAVLIASKDLSQKVKNLVKNLKAKA